MNNWLYFGSEGQMFGIKAERGGKMQKIMITLTYESCKINIYMLNGRLMLWWLSWFMLQRLQMYVCMSVGDKPSYLQDKNFSRDLRKTSINYRIMTMVASVFCLETVI